jgi:pimeloyl-ACP methyl ester carboxylesterase
LVIPDSDKISVVEAISHVPTSTPVLILAGSCDRRARPEEARALYERIQDHAQLMVIDGADHMLLMQADSDGYQTTVQQFIIKCRECRSLHLSKSSR